MENNISWGQAVENNIYWGQNGTNDINFGYVYEYSSFGETFLKKKLN
jgi:hypothetical protein